LARSDETASSYRLCGVDDAPDDDCRDLDRVTDGVVDLEDLAVEVLDPQRDDAPHCRRPGPGESARMDRAEIRPEERDDGGLVGLDHHEAAGGDRGEEEQQRSSHEARRRERCASWAKTLDQQDGSEPNNGDDHQHHQETRDGDRVSFFHVDPSLLALYRSDITTICVSRSSVKRPDAHRAGAIANRGIV
jgi:hypothetical protein